MTSERHAEQQAISVLIVEDDPMAARLVEEMFRDSPAEEFTGVHVERLADAKQRLLERTVDCVLLDLRLPDASWLEALTELREVDPEVPIVILSGLEDEGLAVRAVQSGAQDYLVKGRVGSDTLARSIKYAIERKRTETRLARLAFFDSLTGLPNRDLYMEHLGRALARLERHPSSIAVLFIDLDHFKPINDTLGHGAGDQILIEVGQRLKHSVRPADTVARFGGDEFIALCEEILDERHALSIAHRVETVLSEPFTIEGKEVVVEPSVGIAITSDSETPAEQLIADADAAMYRAKQRRRVSGDRTPRRAAPLS
jgi:diguanylate cyclase (GGDEF)-like protein